MKAVRKIASLIPAFTLWLMLGVLLWGSVFIRITDAPAEQKITLYADAKVTDGTALAVALEKEQCPGIRLVQARPFTYAMFDGDALRKADLYVVPERDVETYREWFSPLPGECVSLGPCLFLDGTPFGVLVYRGETERGAAAQWIQYHEPGAEKEDYYIFLGASSLHLDGNEDAVDNAAVQYLKRFLTVE